MMSRNPQEEAAIRNKVVEAVRTAQVTDIHTHIYAPSFGELLLWGIDDLLTYHYLVAEALRWGVISPESFYRLSKRERADLVWQTLFIDHVPCSEACRGLLTVLDALGLDTGSRDLSKYRAFFQERRVSEHIEQVFALAGVSSVVMTNDVFDDSERPVWQGGYKKDPRFHAALRVDVLLNSWEAAVPRLNGWGYGVSPEITERTCDELRRFLRDWADITDALYMAVSLPPDFALPEDSARSRLISDCLLRVAEERGMPLALMIGVRRAVNPALALAGDALGQASVEAVEYICSAYPKNKFLVTMLSRENQHQLCVSARKFANLMVFGCWWFVNTECLVEEITKMRFDLLGESFVPQHSDARVLDQLIYKWSHSREVIGEVLAERFVEISHTGWKITDEEIERDVSALFGGNFWSFLKQQPR